ncbi:unnamed protein product [Calypogeia fissa]
MANRTSSNASDSIQTQSSIDQHTRVELDQFEEAEAFDSKAEAADAEADRLQELFQVEGRQYERQENAKTKTSPE